MTLELIAGAYNQMPGWAQFLIVWPLVHICVPSLS